MKTYVSGWVVLVLALFSLVIMPFGVSQAEDPSVDRDSVQANAKEELDKPSQTATRPAVVPKALSEGTKHGLTYLVEQQDASGGWGQGGGWRQKAQGNGRVEGNDVKDPPDLGNTCIATLALIRAGNTPQEGPYAKNVARAVAFICDRVESSDKDSMYVTDVRDTQLQSKIGPYVDTFLAGLVLSELKGQMPSDGYDNRFLAALDKTVAKIEKNQQTNGTFNGNTGWASVLSQGLCSKFLDRAAQNSVAVNRDVLDRDFDQSVAGLDKKTGEFKAAAGDLAGFGLAATGRRASLGAASAPSDAGVKLYYSASNASRINDLGNTSAIVEQRAKEVLADKKASGQEKDKATKALARVSYVRGAQQVAVAGIVRNLSDKQFVAGFGNNGGEEFISYMNISEMLLVKGGTEWENWDKSVSESLIRVQNRDGSWSGQHCITGRTFCSAAALLTLMADRAPVPMAAQLQNKQ